MPYFRATIRKLISDQEKYYIKFLPVNDTNVPTEEPAIHSYYSYVKTKTKGKQEHYKVYNKEIIPQAPDLNPGETDYTYSSLFFSRDTKINKISKHPTKFLKKMEDKLQPLFVKTNYLTGLQNEDPTLGVSYYKIQGERPYQEDAILINELDAKFAALDTNAIKNAIIKAFNQAQDEIGELYCGSTALVCLVVNKVLYLANLGDSTGYLVKNNQAKRLNTKLHDGKVQNTKHLLNLNGAIGDNEFGEKMIHTPDIYIINMADEVKNDKIELILASDGLTEASQLKKDDVNLFQRMINQHENYTPEILAKSAILEHNSEDNISVIQVNLKKLLNNKKHAVFAVFDGHCGSRVSNKLSNQFNSILSRHLKTALVKHKQRLSTIHTLFSQPKKVKNEETESNSLRISQ
jgi:serine/threonine protein phosphatase PrpC